jgi:hypothetical protein
MGRKANPWMAWLMLAACCVQVQAHHSFPATYVVDREIRIEGPVVQLMFRNPHSFIHVMAPDSQGTMQRWSIEWAGAGVLARDKISRDTLKPGDTVVVTGHPGRNPADHRMLLRSIVRASDGWKWSGSFE